MALKKKKESSEVKRLYLSVKKKIKPKWRRSEILVRILKEKLSRTIKDENRIIIDPSLNEAIWMRGSKKPLDKLNILIEKEKREEEEEEIWIAKLA